MRCARAHFIFDLRSGRPSIIQQPHGDSDLFRRDAGEDASAPHFFPSVPAASASLDFAATSAMAIDFDGHPLILGPVP
jgi:hypothetical protein